MTLKKRSLSYSILFLSALLLSCSMDHSDSQQTTTQFSISPDQGTLHQTFHITLPAEHPSKLSIRDPKGIWHVVHDADENILLMPYKTFQQATSILVTPEKTQGVSWVEGKRISGPVFQQPGEYLIYFADDLETEPDNTFHFMGTVVVTSSE